MFPLATITNDCSTSNNHGKRRCRRLTQRIHRRLVDTRVANYCIISLNYLSISYRHINNHVSLSSLLSSLNYSMKKEEEECTLPFASVVMNAAQQRLVKHIYISAQRYNRRVSKSEVDNCSDSNHKKQQQMNYNGHIHDHINIKHESLSSSSIVNGYSKSTCAVPLISSQVSLPDQAGAVDMMTVLPQHIINYYRDGTRCLRQQRSCSSQRSSSTVAPQLSSNQKFKKRLGKPRFFGSRDEQVKLYKRMHACGMIEWSKEKPLVVNGLFAVPKGDDGQQRLIIDGRYANEVFDDAPHVSLPSPELLAKLIDPSLPTGQVVVGAATAVNESITKSHTRVPPKKLFVAKCDLSDFFYRFRIPTWMRTYFGLPSLSSDQLGLTEQFGGECIMLWPTLTVLAMGWSHSVFITQNIHEYVLNTMIPSMNPANRINCSNDLLINRMRHMVYIDDLIIIGYDRDEITAAQQQYITTVNNIQLLVKQSKVVQPTTTGVDCLGVEVNGDDMTVGVRPAKLMRLINDTMRMINGGVATGRTMAALVGRWTWAMLIKRSSLSVFSAVYRYIETAGELPYKIWPSVANELRVACGIAPLLYVTITSQWYRTMLASDASMGGLGVSVTNMSSDMNDIQVNTTMERLARQCGVPHMRAMNTNTSDEHDDEVISSMNHAINSLNDDVEARCDSHVMHNDVASVDGVCTIGTSRCAQKNDAQLLSTQVQKYISDMDSSTTSAANGRTVSHALCTTCSNTKAHQRVLKYVKELKRNNEMQKCMSGEGVFNDMPIAPMTSGTHRNHSIIITNTYHQCQISTNTFRRCSGNSEGCRRDTCKNNEVSFVPSDRYRHVPVQVDPPTCTASSTCQYTLLAMIHYAKLANSNPRTEVKCRDGGAHVPATGYDSADRSNLSIHRRPMEPPCVTCLLSITHLQRLPTKVKQEFYKHSVFRVKNDVCSANRYLKPMDRPVGEIDLGYSISTSNNTIWHVHRQFATPITNSVYQAKCISHDASIRCARPQVKFFIRRDNQEWTSDMSMPCNLLGVDMSWTITSDQNVNTAYIFCYKSNLENRPIFSSIFSIRSLGDHWGTSATSLYWFSWVLSLVGQVELSDSLPFVPCSEKSGPKANFTNDQNHMVPQVGEKATQVSGSLTNALLWVIDGAELVFEVYFTTTSRLHVALVSRAQQFFSQNMGLQTNRCRVNQRCYNDSGWCILTVSPWERTYNTVELTTDHDGHHTHSSTHMQFKPGFSDRCKFLLWRFKRGGDLTKSISPSCYTHRIVLAPLVSSLTPLPIVTSSVFASVYGELLTCDDDGNFFTNFRETTPDTSFDDEVSGGTRWLGRGCKCASWCCNEVKNTCKNKHDKNELMSLTRGNDVQVIPKLHECIGISESSCYSSYVTENKNISSNESHKTATREKDDELFFGDFQKWIPIISEPWHAREHINSFEMRAASTAIRWMLSHPKSINKRVMMMNDSQVTVGVMSKGRTSSHILLRRMRSISAHILASGIEVYTRWIPSQLNPADKPSRKYSPRW